MIYGNQTWQAVLQSGAKQPLYLFEIPDLGLVIASFSMTPPQALPATVGLPPPIGGRASGYGVTLMGVGGYGT